MANNPFSMTFGIEPANLINRIKETDKIISEFSGNQTSNYVYIITGLRGSGKTVLLSSIASKLSEDKNWIVVDPGPKDNILENVASEIYETTKAKKLFVKGEFSFSFHGLTFSLKGDEPVTTVNTLLKKMLGYLKDKNKKVLITIDEIDNSDQMKTFIQAYQSLLRLKYPLYLLMTGLYENVSKLQEDKSLTFLYRAPKIRLEPLYIGSIASAYETYLNSTKETSLELAKLTKGYAYAYQVLGYLMFGKGLRDLTPEVLSEFDQYLADYVYDKIYSELSKKEQEILHGFKEDRPMKIEELSLVTNIDSKIISVYRDRLIKRGILYSPTYGYLEITLPRFINYLETKYI
ncbi:MAG: KAP family NTPase [Bacillales bacterium]|nr:KAP family NTPase [Bacillales bacterium]MDD7714806.1 ATP-binding protein [Mollicutes bacterium]MDY4935694.1 ATP-binding protein [Candidatus Enteromonas sp.]